MQGPAAIAAFPCEQYTGPPAMMPAPFLIVFEYAKCICAAMKAPDEKPDIETSLTLTLYLGRVMTAPDALALNTPAKAAAARYFAKPIRLRMVSPIKFIVAHPQVCDASLI